MIKRAIKSALLRVSNGRMLVLYWRWRGKDVGFLSDRNRADRFRRIYDEGVWTKDDPSAPLSGLGSAVSATTTLREQLPVLLKDLQATSLLDVGCGDFTWMAMTPLGVDHYTGVDIVPSVIASNNAAYADLSHTFLVMDVCETVPPKADAILCREVLFHLSFKDGRQAIENMRRSGAKFLITSSDPAGQINEDIVTGDFRDINLCLAPYGLGPPERSISEAGGPNANRILGVWRLD